MLGDIQSQECIRLMRQMETQSKQTLASWAVAYASGCYLPIYENRCPGNPLLRDTLSACGKAAAGLRTFTSVKPLLQEVRQAVRAKLARDTTDPVGQVVAHAVATACATLQTPTSALGFLFYGAAAYAYSQAGLSEGPEVYEALAAEELLSL